MLSPILKLNAWVLYLLGTTILSHKKVHFTRSKLKGVKFSCNGMLLKILWSFRIKTKSQELNQVVKVLKELAMDLPFNATV